MLLPFSQFPNNQAAELSLDLVWTYIHGHGYIVTACIFAYIFMLYFLYTYHPVYFNPMTVHMHIIRVVVLYILSLLAL